MKEVIFKILFFTTIFCNAQNYDVRNVNWGMSINDVINSEYPLEGNLNGNQLRYNNVDIGNGFTSALLYEFSNGKLIKLKYIIYGNPAFKGTCKNIISLVDKVKYTTYIIETLYQKGYKCDMGWYLVNNTSLAQETGNRNDFWNCKLDYNTVSKVDKLAKEKNAVLVAIGLENERSHASFYYNEYQNSEANKETNLFPCDSDYYNTYLWLEITPNYKVKNELNKNRF